MQTPDKPKQAQEASQGQDKEATKPDPFANPFVQAAFSPSKINSFKSIAMQARLAQIRPIVSPQKDKVGSGIQAAKPRASFTAMLLRRSNTKADIAMATSPTKVKDIDCEKKLNAPKEAAVAAQQESVSVEETKQRDDPVATMSGQQEDVSIAKEQDKQEPEPEQASNNDDAKEKEIKPFQIEQESNDPNNDTLVTPDEAKPANDENGVSVAGVRDSPFEMAKDASQERTTRESSQQESKAVTAAESDDKQNIKSSSPAKIIGVAKMRRNRKQARFSVPLNVPINVYDDSETTQERSAYNPSLIGSSNSNASKETGYLSRRSHNKQNSVDLRCSQPLRDNGRDLRSKGQKQKSTGASGGAKTTRNNETRSSEPTGYGNQGRNSYVNKNGNNASAQAYGQQSGRQSNVGQKHQNSEKSSRYLNNTQHGNSQKGSNNKDQMAYIKYKTTLCRHFDETGLCSLGDACSFAHGDNEKRGMADPMPMNYPGRHYVGAVHSNYKTQVCRNFEQTGMCKFQDNCCFAHGPHELRSLTDPLPPIPREVLLYCPPNMKLLPSHGNIQIIPPKAGEQDPAAFQAQQMGGVFFTQQQDMNGYPMAGQQDGYVFNPMEPAYFQNAMSFGHDPPQPFVNFGQQQNQQPYGNAFANFTPPGQQSANNVFQNTYPMPFQQASPQPQDEKPMQFGAGHQQV